jgi:putative C-S lyase
MSKYDFSRPLARKRSWKWTIESIVDGCRVLPMSVADTDFVSPREVTETLREIVDAGEFGYCAYPEDHREVYAAWQQKQHGWALDPDDVIIANGLLGSLSLMLEAVSAPGDGVIVFTPVYHNFFHSITSAGREPRRCDLVCDEHNRWQLDFQAYQALCERADTRAVLICNPHNPVGRVWSAEELKSMLRIAQANDVIVFSDEVHADFVYDRRFDPTIKVAENPEGVMALSSGSKTFNIGGMFASYAMTEDDRLKTMLRKGLDRLSWEQDRFGAWGSYAAFRHGYRYRDEVVAYVRKMQTRMVDALNRMPFPVKAALPEATYLLWADFRDTGWSADEIHRFLVEEASLGFNRGDSYGAKGAGFARINCAVPESRIDEAIRRLSNAFENRFANRARPGRGPGGFPGAGVPAV